MALILCLETATTNCSVALSENGKNIAIKEDFSKSYSHAEKLHLFIEAVFKEIGVKKENIDAIAVSKGPGSYTGLRIGVSAAKGLCYALEKPLISVSTLQALALQVKPIEDGAFVIPMLDARRMEVYASVFNDKQEQIQDIQAIILNENSFEEFLNTAVVYFIGNANDKFKEICSHPNARFIDDKLPSANEMCFLANQKYKISDMENVAYFEPFYLKDFVGG